MAKKKTETENKEAGKKQSVEAIRQALDQAENQLRIARNLLFSELYDEKASQLKSGDERVVEGVFDGESMKGADGKKYPVPPNYASKSKLVPGDILKLSIEEDGTFLYKQIAPVERKRIIGYLLEDNGNFFVTVEGKNYQILPASVTYFKAKEGNKITLIVPRDEESEWGAVENVLP